MTELRLVHGCPAWCTADHADGEPTHVGKDHEVAVRGLRLLEGQLTMEAGDQLPRLAVSADGLGWLRAEVLELDHAAAHDLIGQLQAFTQRLQNQLNVLAGTPPKKPKKKVKKRPLGPDLQHAPRETRLYLAERDGWQCFYCRAPFDTLKEATSDHYIPRSVWPCNLPANLVLSCEPCNIAKADRLTWSMAAVLLAWAREGGTGEEAEAPIRAVPAA
jgi:hypothetical protein